MSNQPNIANQSVNTLVDCVYVLSVKTFSERIAHIENEMRKHHIVFQFVFAHDIPDIQAETLSATFGDCTLSMAQKSLVLKHIEAWRDAAKNGYHNILIFEDDAVLHADFSTYFKNIMQAAQALKPAQLIFLGGADAKVPDYFLLSSDVLVPLSMSTAEGYITDLTAIEHRLNWLASNKITLPADHLMSKIDPALNIVHYWSRTAIVEQGSVTGIFTSALDTHRQKHSRQFNIARYHWNKFQRHVLRRLLAQIRQLYSKAVSKK